MSVEVSAAIPSSEDPAYRGIVGTPVTPFTSTGDVDWQAFERLLEFLIKSEVDALALPMHIAESLNLTVEERKQLVREAVKIIDGRVPLIAHVSSSGTNLTIDLAKDAESAGASAVLVLPPYYWQSPPEALLDHFEQVGRAVDLDLLVYNYPARAGVTLEPDLLARLIDRLPRFVGIKDASFNNEYLVEVRAVTQGLRPEFSIFSGVEFLLPTMAIGGSGAFSATGAIVPYLIRDLYHACRKEDFALARDLQAKFALLWRVVQAPYPSAIKVAMGYMDRGVGVSRSPIQMPGEAQSKLIRATLDELGLLEGEPHGWDL